MVLVHEITGKEPKQELAIQLIMQQNTAAHASSLLKAGYGTIESLNLSEDNVYVEDRPDGSSIEWVLPHSKEFPTFINKYFGENPKYQSVRTNFIEDIKRAMESGSEAPPFAYQLFIRDYLRYGTPYRSLLLEHGLGSGKSRSSIMVAETFREQGLTTLILTPAFLRLNFMDEIKRWGNEDIRITNDMSLTEKSRRLNKIYKHYKFVHYNATGYGLSRNGNEGKGSVFEQLARLGIGFSKTDPKYGNLFPYLNQKYGDLSPPKRMLIIIEEIHGMNRSFTKGSTKLRYYLYPLLMMAEDCKIIGLSGTPIVNSPFEMATLYNVLRGPMKGSGRALPENEMTFNDNFIDYENLTVRNGQTLGSRILGLGSLFKGITNDEERIIYPSGKDDHKIVQLEMSQYQSIYHDTILTREKETTRSRTSRLVNLGNEPVGTMGQAQAELEPTSAYHTKSRQACNFAFPEEITRPDKKNKGSWSDITDYIFQFNSNIDRVWDFFKQQGFALDDFEEEYNDIQNSGQDGLRKLLSTITRYAYETDPPVKNSHPMVKANLLSERDLHTVRLHMGDYKQRLQETIIVLTKNADKYFSMDGLKKYAVKMEYIYRSIISDTDNGATYVDSSQSQTSASTETEDDDTLDIPPGTELPEIQDQDDEEETASLATASKIEDPNDPFNEQKYQDVYLPDHEIKGKVKGGPALVYSYFNTVEGAGIFSKILEAHGFTEFVDSTISMEDDPKSLKRAPRYAFVKGGMKTDLKIKIMKVFNSRANAHGQLIRVIFATQAAAEGISLFSLRQIHIMEPHWENSLIDQVIGRGFRLRSHKYLEDRDERRIQVYRYFTTSDEYGTDTADGIVQTIADKKSKLISQLKTIRAMSAVDCTLNSEYNQLDVPCLTFHGQVGKAYTGALEDDIRHQIKAKANIQSCAYKVYKTKNGEWISLDRENKVKIQITSEKGTRVYDAQPAYSSTVKLEQGQALTETALRLTGYILTLKEGKKGFIRLDPSKVKVISTF